MSWHDDPEVRPVVSPAARWRELEGKVEDFLETYRANLEAREASDRAYHEEFVEAIVVGPVPMVEAAQWEKAALAEIDEFYTKGGDRIGKPTR